MSDTSARDCIARIVMIFPMHSPRIDRIEVERKGDVRRAKLTYLRKRIGKGATLVKEKGRETAAKSSRPVPAS